MSTSRAIKYEAVLPEAVAERAEEERDLLLDHLLEQLKLAAQTEDVSLRHVSSQLNSFLAAKFTIPLEKRVELAQVLEQLVLREPLPSDLHGRLCAQLAKVVRKPKDLREHWRVPDWRAHLAAVMHAVDYTPAQRTSGQVDGRPNLGALVGMLRKLRRFFGDDATQGIVDEVMGMMQPGSEAVFVGQALLVTLLPTRVDHDEWKVWLDKVMHLWDYVENCNEWDLMWMHLLARLAKHQLGRIDWAPYLPRIMGHVVRLCGVENASGGTSNRGAPMGVGSFVHAMATSLRCVGKFLVYAQNPQDNLALRMYADFLRMTQTCFYPSNSGPWVQPLADCVAGFARQLSKRVAEAAAAADAGDQAKASALALSEEDVNAAVEAMQPALMQGIQSKQGGMVSGSMAALKHLAHLRPAMILPPLVEDTYQAIDMVDQAHRTTTSMQVLARVLRPLLTTQKQEHGWPLAPSHLGALLAMTLPGIDTNDPGKTFDTLRLYYVVLSWVPIVDCASEERPNSVEDDSVADLARSASASLEAWAVDFVNKLLGVFEHQDEPTAAEVSSTGPLTEMTMHLLFQQLGKRGFDLCLDAVLRSVTTQVNYDARRNTGHLLSGAARARPQATLAKAVPALCQAILDRTQEDTLAQVSSTKLRWSVYLLAKTVRYAGAAVLEYSDTLQSILSATLAHKEDKVRHMAGKLLRYTLYALTAEYMVDLRSHAPSLWQDGGEFERTHYMHWGTAYDHTTAEAQWHRMSEAEAQLADKLIADSLALADDKLAQAMGDTSGGNTLSRELKEGVGAALSVYSNVLRGAAVYLPEWSGEVAFDGGPQATLLELPRGLRESHEAAQDNTRYHIAEQLHGLVDHLTRGDGVHQDEAAIMERASEVIGQLVAHSAVQPRHTRNEAFLNKQIKRQYKTPLMGSTHARSVTLQRAMCVYDARVAMARRALPLQRMHVRLMDDLWLLMRNRYEQTSRGAGNALRQCLSRFPFQRMRYLHAACDVLESTTYDEAHRAEVLGAVALLAQGAMMERAGRQYRALGRVVPALLHCVQHSDHDKVTQGVYKVFMSMGRAVTAVPGATWATYEQVRTRLPAALQVEQTRMEDAQQTHADAREKEVTAHRGLLGALLEVLERGEAGEGSSSVGKEEAETQAKDGMVDGWGSKVIASTLMTQAITQELVLSESEEDREAVERVMACSMAQLVSELPPLRTAAVHVLVRILAIQHRRQRDAAMAYTPSYLAPNTSFDGWHAYVADPVQASVEGQEQVVTGLDSKWGSEAVRQALSSQEYIHSMLAYMAQDQPPSNDAGGGNSLRARMMAVMMGGGRTGFSDTIDGMLKMMLGTLQLHWYETTWSGLSDRSFVSAYAILLELLMALYGRHDAGLPELLTEAQALMEVDASTQGTGGGEQVTAAYVLAGMCRALHAWPIEERRAAVEQVRPVVARALRDASPGHASQWALMLGYAVREQPLSACQWLVDLVMEETFAADTSFGQTKRLAYTRMLVAKLGWRLREAWPALVEGVLDQIDVSYKQTRGALAGLLAMAFAARWTPLLDTHTQVDFVAHRSPSGHDALLHETLDMLLGRLQALEEEERERMSKGNTNGTEGMAMTESSSSSSSSSSGGGGVGTQESVSKYRKHAEVLVEWVNASIDHGVAHVLDAHIPQVLPVLFTLQEDHTEQEVSNMAVGCLIRIAKTPMSSGTLSAVVEQLTEAQQSSSWRARGSILPFVMSMHVRQRFVMDAEQSAAVFNLVVQSLQDSQLEVREAAAGSLAVMARGMAGSVRADLLQQFTTVAATKLPKKSKKSKKTSTQSVQQDAMEVEGNQDDEEDKAKAARKERKMQKRMMQRHGGVLGLSALVLASPYSVPDWMPDVLMTLAGHVGDPTPIKDSVKDLFREFRKTHTDTWFMDKHKFTSDQLGVLTDLMVSPSYYV